MLNVADARKVFTPFADPIIFFSLAALYSQMQCHCMDSIKGLLTRFSQ